MTGLALFLLSLPMAVYLFAGVFGLIDQEDKVAALLTLSWRVLLAAGIVTVAGHENSIWVAAAFILVMALHGAIYGVGRWAITTGRWITQRIE